MMMMLQNNNSKWRWLLIITSTSNVLFSAINITDLELGPFQPPNRRFRPKLPANRNCHMGSRASHEH